MSFPPASSLQALIDHIDVASKREYGKTLVVNHGQAKLFFVSGAASHATATTQNGAELTGSAALAELIDLCARTVSLEWEDDNNEVTLTLDVGDLVAMVKSHIAAPPDGGLAPIESVPSLPIEMAEAALTANHRPLPPLPQALDRLMEGSPADLGLDAIVAAAEYPILVLFHSEHRLGAAVVAGHHVVDAMFATGSDVTVGPGATQLLRQSTSGHYSVYGLHPALLEMLPLIWRLTPSHLDVPTEWLNADEFMGWIGQSPRPTVITVIHGADTLVAFYDQGMCLGLYTDTDPVPRRELKELEQAISRPGGLATIQGQDNLLFAQLRRTVHTEPEATASGEPDVTIAAVLSQMTTPGPEQAPPPHEPVWLPSPAPGSNVDLEEWPEDPEGAGGLFSQPVRSARPTVIPLRRTATPLLEAFAPAEIDEDEVSVTVGADERVREPNAEAIPSAPEPLAGPTAEDFPLDTSVPPIVADAFRDMLVTIHRACQELTSADATNEILGLFLRNGAHPEAMARSLDEVSGLPAIVDVLAAITSRLRAIAADYY